MISYLTAEFQQNQVIRFDKSHLILCSYSSIKCKQVNTVTIKNLVSCLDLIDMKSIITINMRSNQQNIVGRPVTSIPTLLQQFSSIDFQNKELIKFAERIQRSSLMSNDTFSPQIIRSIQEDLRKNLAGLISNLYQVIEDIDKRLQGLSQFFQQTSNHSKTMILPNHAQFYQKDNSQKSRSSTPFIMNHTPVDPYQLNQRITSLEISLKNSQQNEAKLISILQKLQIRNTQQPKLMLGINSAVQSKVYRAFSRQSIQKSRQNSEKSQGNFRLFALQRNIHENKTEDGSVKTVQQRKPPRNLLNCAGQGQKDNLEPSRIEPKLPRTIYEKSEASTYSRRLSFMMNTLNYS